MAWRRGAIQVNHYSLVVASVLLASACGAGTDDASEGPKVEDDSPDEEPEETDDAPVLPGLGSSSDQDCDGVINDDPGETPIARISHRQYINILRAVFPSVDLPQIALTPDPISEGFDNAADQLRASPLAVNEYNSVAELVAGAIVDQRERWSECENERTCVYDILDRMAPKLFRHPLGEEQYTEYRDFMRTMVGSYGMDGVKLGLAALLQAPDFLYRLEVSGEGAPGEVVVLDGYEIAARMSLMILGTVPDDELLSLVDELDEPAVREEQARRLLATDAAAITAVDFHYQWLNLDEVLREDKDAMAFPDWGEGLRESAHEETEHFIRYVYDNSGTLGSVLTSRKAPVDERLAELYGVSAPDTPWEVVTLPAEERAGILTRAAFLAGNAHTSNGSPPLRGVEVLQQLLCISLPDPPENADTSTPAATEDEGPKTNRQLFEERTSSSTCQGCHQLLDPIGFGFEAYDAIGAFRSKDNSLPVDASGELLGKSFDDAIEMSEILAESPEVMDCATSQMFRYAIGRRLVEADGCRLNSLQSEFKDSDGDWRELLVSIVKQPAFTRRRVAEE